MNTAAWQIETPVDAFVFDCDGTLSSIEGIDELAKYNGVSDVVGSLTAMAMGKTGINPNIYQQRLSLVNPSAMQVQSLGKLYLAHQSPDAHRIIQIFQRLKKKVYLVSAGLAPAVSYFGERLGIPRQQIYAVNIHFDDKGDYVDFDHTSPMVHNAGKRDVLRELNKQHKTIHYIGDGLNDIAVIDLVSRFIGYGGAYYRQNIADQCQFYIREHSLAALLPLSLTPNEYRELSVPEQELYQHGLSDIEQDAVMIRSHH